MEKDKWPTQKEFCCDEAMGMKSELDYCKQLLQKHGIHMVSKQCWCNPTVENDCCAEPDTILNNAMKEPKLNLEIKPCGDCWLHIDAPSGNKASINLGQRCGMESKGIVSNVLREVATQG